MTEDPVRTAVTEVEVQRRVKEMKDAELIDFIRTTVTHLEILADRLESLTGNSDPEGETDNATTG